MAMSATGQVALLKKLGSEIAGPGQLDREQVLSCMMYGSRAQVLAALKRVQQAGTVAAELHVAEAVKELMGHQDPEVCAAAVAAMGAMGTVMAKYSEDMATYLLQHPDAACRAATLDALGGLGSGATAGVRESVAEKLGDGDAQVRQSALRALGAIRDTEHIEAIKGALVDQAPGVRGAALEVLGRLVACSQEVESMYTTGELAPQLVELLANGRTRYSALVAIQSIGHRVPAACAEATVAALRDADGLTREAAAEAIGGSAEVVMRSSSAVSKLKELLTDTDSGVRAAAACAVGQIGITASSFAPLVAELLDDDSEDASGLAAQMGTGARRLPARLRFPKCAAVATLGQLGSTSYVKDIGKAVAHENWEVRACACEALGSFGTSAVEEIGVLTQAAEDGAFPVRAMACYALGELQRPDAVDTLVEKLADPAHTVRLHAVSALGHLGSHAEEYSHDIFKLLDDPAPPVRAAAAICLSSLGQVGQSYAGVIAGLLHEAEPEVRASALQALAALGDHGAAFGDEICDRYYNDSSPMVQQVAGSTASLLGLLVGPPGPVAEALEDEEGPVAAVASAADTRFEGLGLYYAEIQEKKKELQSSGKWVEGLF